MIIKSDLFKKISGNAFWSLTGAAFSKGAILLSSIVVARILGQTQYGELGVIRSTVNMFVVFASFGLGLTATKYISELKEINKEKVSNIIGLMYIFSFFIGLIITLIVILSSEYIAEKTINAPHLQNEIILGGIMLFFSSINGAQVGILNGFEEFKKIAVINLVVGILSFPLQVLFAYLFGLIGAVIGFGLNFAILWLLNFYVIKKLLIHNNITVSFKKSFSEYRVLYQFSFPALLSGLLVTPVIWICNVLLVNQENGYNQMAIYDASNQWKNIILMMPAAMSSIILPMLSKLNQNKDEYNQVLKINLFLNIFISLILSLIIIFLSSYIMSAYGDGFSSGKNVLIILSISTIFVTYNGVIGQAIASKGKMWLGFFLNLIWGVSLVTLSDFFLKKGYGSLGLAYAFLLSYLIHSISQTIAFFNTSLKSK